MTSTAETVSKPLFSKTVPQWFILTVVILSVVTIFAYRSIQVMIVQNRWVSHTHEVIETIGSAIGNLYRMQGDVRGFVISGQPLYLSDFVATRPQVQKEVIKLQEMVKDNPAQAERAHAFFTAVNQRFDIGETTIKTYQESGFKAAADRITGGIGQHQMEEVQKLASVMQDTERELLAQRESDAHDAAYTALMADAFGVGAGLLVLSLVFWLIQREASRREQSEVQMQRAIWETQQISNMADFLQGCQTTQEAFEIIGQNLPRFIPGTRGLIGMINNSHNAIQTAKCWGENSTCPLEFPPEECWALRRGRIHLYEGDQNNPKCSHIAGNPVASLCVPLVAHGEMIGLLYIESEDRATFSEERTRFIRIVAEQASLAIANLKLQETLRYQSIRDPLTKLFNRRYMEATLEREISRARRQKQPLSVIMADIDHFKKFNDTYGHEAGDAVLMEFGKLLAQHARSEDVACRLGGEEFILLLPGADMDCARERAELLCRITRQMAVQHNREALGNVTVSLGVACYPEHGELPESLLNLADVMLYQAKRNGRDQVAIAGQTGKITANKE